MACTGIEYCKLAIVETKGLATATTVTELEHRLADVADQLDGPISLHVNGCPNSCARIQVADIGLKGQIVTDDDGEQVPGFQVHLGGALGLDPGFGRKVRGLKVTAEELPDYVERVVRRYVAERAAGRALRHLGRASDGGGADMSTVTAPLRDRVAGRRPRAGRRPGARDRPLGGRGDRRQPRGGRQHAGLRDLAPGLAGAARRGRAVPGHRLPLPRDAADARPGAGPARRQRGRRARRSRPSPSRTPSTAPRLHDRDPGLCCFLRKVAPLAEALAPYDAWVTGLRRDESPTRASTPVLSWDDKHDMLKVCPLATWTDGRRRGLPGRARPAAQRPGAAGVRLHRLPALHPAGRARRGPARPVAGPAPTRSSAASTSDCGARVSHIHPHGG